MVISFGRTARASSARTSTSTVKAAGSTGASTIRSRYSPAAPMLWWVTCPAIDAGGTMITFPGSQHARKEYRVASAPDPTRTSAYAARKTRAARAAATTSICSMASRPISYFSPG
jgi:hypothetical protein